MATLDDVRRLALALPGTHEADHFGVPSFRVGKASYASLGRGEPTVILRLDPEDQRNLALAHPGIVEPVSGPGVRIAKAARAGWTTVWFERCDDALLASLLKLAWSGVAPR